MNELQRIFDFQGQELRSVLHDGEPWFVAKDVCDILEIKNSRDAVSRLDFDEKAKVGLTDGSQERYFTIVNEPGLYTLILSSRKAEAREFKRWITHDVIPNIRKHGAYMTPETIEKSILNPDFIINLAGRLKDEQQKRMAAEQTIEQQRPKVLFAESVQASENSVLVRELARMLFQKGIDIGERRLFEWLRANGFLIKQKGESFNLPTQKSMILKLFEIHKRTLTDPDGSIRVTRTPKVTGKGQVYFLNKLLNEKAVV